MKILINDLNTLNTPTITLFDELYKILLKYRPKILNLIQHFLIINRQGFTDTQNCGIDRQKDCTFSSIPPQIHDTLLDLLGNKKKGIQMKTFRNNPTYKFYSTTKQLKKIKWKEKVGNVEEEIDTTVMEAKQPHDIGNYGENYCIIERKKGGYKDLVNLDRAKLGKDSAGELANIDNTLKSFSGFFIGRDFTNPINDLPNSNNDLPTKQDWGTFLESNKKVINKMQKKVQNDSESKELVNSITKGALCSTDNIDTKVFFVFGITGSGKGQFNYIMDWYKKNVYTGLLKVNGVASTVEDDTTATVAAEDGSSDGDDVKSGMEKEGAAATEDYNLGYYFNNIIKQQEDGWQGEMEAPTPLNPDSTRGFIIKKLKTENTDKNIFQIDVPGFEPIDKILQIHTKKNLSANMPYASGDGNLCPWDKSKNALRIIIYILQILIHDKIYITKRPKADTNQMLDDDVFGTLFNNPVEFQMKNNILTIDDKYIDKIKIPNTKITTDTPSEQLPEFPKYSEALLQDEQQPEPGEFKYTYKSSDTSESVTKTDDKICKMVNYLMTSGVGGSDTTTKKFIETLKGEGEDDVKMLAANVDGIGGINKSIYTKMLTKGKYKTHTGDTSTSNVIFTPLSIIQRCLEGIYIINTLNYMGNLMKEKNYNLIMEYIKNYPSANIEALLNEIDTILKSAGLEEKKYDEYLPFYDDTDEKVKKKKWKEGFEDLNPFQGKIMKTDIEQLDEKFGVNLKKNKFLIDFIGMLSLGDIVTDPEGLDQETDTLIISDFFKPVNDEKRIEKKIARYDMNVIKPFRYDEDEYKTYTDSANKDIENLIVNRTLHELFQTGTESFTEILKASD